MKSFSQRKEELAKEFKFPSILQKETYMDLVKFVFENKDALASGIVELTYEDIAEAYFRKGRKEIENNQKSQDLDLE